MLARALGPEDRGHLALLVLIAVLAAELGALGLPFALTYSVARVPGRTIEIVEGVRRATAIRLVAATMLAVSLLVILTMGAPGYVKQGAVVAAAAAIPIILQACGVGVLQGLQRFTSFNVLRASPNAAFAIAAGALLLAGEDGFVELTLAWGATLAVVLPVTLRKARQEAERLHDPRAPSPPTTSWILRFGRRSMLGAAPPVETYRVDQSVVALFLAPVSLGLYVVALAFTNLPRFIAQAVGLVANPFVAASETQAQARRRMWYFAWAAIPLYLPVVAGLWIAAPALTTFFFGSAFADAADLTRLLLIATAFYCARRVLIDAARGAGYPLAGSVAEVIALIAAIPLFGFFVPASGVDGVAYALIGSSAVALAVLIGMLLRPGDRRATPSGWFETLPAEVPGSLSGPLDGAESVPDWNWPTQRRAPPPQS